MALAYIMGITFNMGVFGVYLGAIIGMNMGSIIGFVFIWIFNMKFKKMMLVTLLLLAILTIGAVSASEDADALAVDEIGGAI